MQTHTQTYKHFSLLPISARPPLLFFAGGVCVCICVSNTNWPRLAGNILGVASYYCASVIACFSVSVCACVYLCVQALFDLFTEVKVQIDTVERNCWCWCCYCCWNWYTGMCEMLQVMMLMLAIAYVRWLMHFVIYE